MNNSAAAGNDDAVNEVIREIIDSDRIVLFMKGTPRSPMCGFSQQVSHILFAEGLDNFGSFNVLENNTVREGIKRFSNWPTIPQLYVDGEFLGGCDIVTTMHQDGDLKSLLEEKGLAGK